jgi:hypothetical protein
MGVRVSLSLNPGYDFIEAQSRQQRRATATQEN